MARVVVKNNGLEFDCPATEIVLDAALAAGIALPHQCRGAHCGTCKAKLIEGNVDHGWSFSLAISDQEKAEGMFLACQAKPLTPSLVIDMAQPMPAETVPAIEIEAEVVAIRAEARRVSYVALAPLNGQSLPYEAGAYAELKFTGAPSARAYSFASAPSARRILDFYIALHSGGAASGFVHDKLRLGDHVKVRGPLGTCRAPEGREPLLAIAGGTGLAPVLAIIEQVLERDPAAPIHLLFSVREAADAFALERLHGLRAAHPSFAFDLTITDKPSPLGRFSALVPDLLPCLYPALSGHRVIMAGSPAMMDACLATLLKHGADPRKVAVDSFVPAAPSAVAA